MRIPKPAKSVAAAAAVVLTVYLVGAALAAAGLTRDGDYVSRDFYNEFRFRLWGHTMSATLACETPPQLRVVRLRARRWGEAKAYLKARFPDCRVKHSMDFG
ncbi:MAG: hypothetical protein QNJ30_03270 [Kiloniellales bacterium]|nr:hypothetical protein [Kiloniellales bacterium]